MIPHQRAAVVQYLVPLMEWPPEWNADSNLCGGVSLNKRVVSACGPKSDEICNLWGWAWLS